MSLHPHRLDEVPADTREVARAAFPKGHPYLRLRDELGALFQDEAFADLFSLSGQSAQSPGRLALVLMLQEAERSRCCWRIYGGAPGRAGRMMAA